MVLKALLWGNFSNSARTLRGSWRYPHLTVGELVSLPSNDDVASISQAVTTYRYDSDASGRLESVQNWGSFLHLRPFTSTLSSALRIWSGCIKAAS
jgi:hypothetical protein